MNRQDLHVIFQLFAMSSRLQKKRAWLTIAAIAWGTVAILLLLSFGEGLKRQLTQNSLAMGENLSIMWPGETTKAWKGLPPGRRIRPVADDIELLKQRIPELKAVIGEITSWRTALEYGPKTVNGRVTGVNIPYGDARKHFAQAGGRFGIESKLFGETAKIEIAGRPVWLLRPATFMNLSGKSVAAALRYWKIEPEQALLAHDELDLPPGVARLKFDGGHGGQNGLRDTIKLLGHGRFHRLRIGIGHPGHKDRVVSWVLGRPGADDDILINRAIDDALDVLPLAVRGDFAEAMKRLHTARGAGG